jgi:formylglycine-generating enzyme required for sulfatase activity
VGSYPQGTSPYGALDMTGNVWEWVNDWWQSDYYSVSPDENPPGPTTGTYKVLRGGYWDNPAVLPARGEPLSHPILTIAPTASVFGVLPRQEIELLEH